MKLSENFSLEEFMKSQTAVRKGIENYPDPDSVRALQNLCVYVLQPVRENFGPIIINSGYRSPALNMAIGGSATSQHCFGQAADIESSKYSTYEVGKWIKDNLDFDQLILEFYTPGDPNSGWVHVSFKNHKTNRNQALTASRKDGKVVYAHWG